MNALSNALRGSPSIEKETRIHTPPLELQAAEKGKTKGKGQARSIFQFGTIDPDMLSGKSLSHSNQDNDLSLRQSMQRAEDETANEISSDRIALSNYSPTPSLSFGRGRGRSLFVPTSVQNFVRTGTGHGGRKKISEALPSTRVLGRYTDADVDADAPLPRGITPERDLTDETGRQLRPRNDKEKLEYISKLSEAVERENGVLNVSIIELQNQLAVSDQDKDHWRHRYHSEKTRADQLEGQNKVYKETNDSLLGELLALRSQFTASQISQPENLGLSGSIARASPPNPSRPRSVVARDSTSDSESSGNAVAQPSPANLHLNARRSSMKVPSPRNWSGNAKEKGEEDITVFLPKLKAYFEHYERNEAEMVADAHHYLTGKAFQLWELEKSSILAKGLLLTWDRFTVFMQTTFGAIQPERQARAQYERLHQDGHVFKYVTEMKKLVQMMSSSDRIKPSEGDVIQHFIANAQPDLKAYLVSETPPNYWKDADEVFTKAINWGTNQRAAKVPSAPKKLATLEKKRAKRERYRAKKADTAYAAAGSLGGGGNTNKRQRQGPATPQWSKREHAILLKGGCPSCREEVASHTMKSCPFYEERCNSTPEAFASKHPFA